MLSRLAIFSLAMSYLTIVVASLPAQEVSPEEKKDGFVSLFNGKDFANWRFNGDKKPEEVKNWKVADGLIQLSGGGNPHLASEKEYANFEFRFEWRALKPKYNGGFYVRSGKNVGSNQLNLAAGNEGQLVGGKAEGAKSAGALQKPAGEWNAWRVICEGEKLTFYCNDKLAFEATGFKPASGHLGFQAEGAALEFRNMRIREIK